MAHWVRWRVGPGAARCREASAEPKIGSGNMLPFLCLTGSRGLTTMHVLAAQESPALCPWPGWCGAGRGLYWQGYFKTPWGRGSVENPRHPATRRLERHFCRRTGVLSRSAQAPQVIPGRRGAVVLPYFWPAGMSSQGERCRGWCAAPLARRQNSRAHGLCSPGRSKNVLLLRDEEIGGDVLILDILQLENVVFNGGFQSHVDSCC